MLPNFSPALEVQNAQSARENGQKEQTATIVRQNKAKRKEQTRVFHGQRLAGTYPFTTVPKRVPYDQKSGVRR